MHQQPIQVQHQQLWYSPTSGDVLTKALWVGVGMDEEDQSKGLNVVAASPNSPQPRASAMLFPGFPAFCHPIGIRHWRAALFRFLWLNMALYGGQFLWL
jgi:hypothetical protein